MKNLIILVFAFILSSFSSLAQETFGDIELMWGDLRETKELVEEEIIGTDTNFIYGFRPHKKKQFLGTFVKYNKSDFSEVWVTDVENFEYHDKDAVLIKREIIDGEVHLLFTVYHRSEDKRFLLASYIDKEGVQSDIFLLQEMEAKKRKDGSYNIRSSRNDEFLVVLADMPGEKDENEIIGIQVLNRKYESIWNTEIELPYSDKSFERKLFEISNAGNVYFTGIKRPDKSKGEKKVRKASNEEHLAFKVSNKGQDVQEIDLNLGDIFVQNLAVRLDYEEDIMLFTGFYGNKDEYEMSGAFFIKMKESTLENTVSTREEFPRDIVASVIGEKKAKKGKSIKGNWVFRDYIAREDGGAVIVAERHFVQAITTSNGRTTTTTYYYHYEDVLVMNFNPNGTLDWTSHIPKEQITVNDGGIFCGYLLLVHNDRLHFIYNDHKKNPDLISKGRSKIKTFSARSLKKGNVVGVTIDANGDMIYEVLMKIRDEEKMLFLPRVSQSSVGNYTNAVVFAFKPTFLGRGKTKLGLLTLEGTSEELAAPTEPKKNKKRNGAKKKTAKKKTTKKR